MESAIKLAEAVVPGVGPPLYALNVVRKLWSHMQESKVLCASVQTRLDIIWAKLQEMDEENTIPRKFKLTDFTEIVAKFHTLVLKQAEKSLIVRIGTAASFVMKLRGCHEEIDQLCDLLRLHVAESLMQWRGEWQRNVEVMAEQINQIATTGAAIRVDLGGVRESIEALTVLVHEQQKQTDFNPIVESLQAICFQLAREHKLALPNSVPPWFFTFDDIDYDPSVSSSPCSPSKASSSSPAMGTIHKGTWGSTTRVIIKRIKLPVPMKRSSSIVTWKEADVWWNLNHPNVLRMYGACHVTQPAFIVCEEATNGNIRDFLASDSRRIRQFWRLQLDVAVALVYLREKHVVHGNLKCNNILIGSDGRAKITDFGFSYIRSMVDSTKQPRPEPQPTLGTNQGADSDPQDSHPSLLGAAPFVASWPAPELRAAAERGERMVPSYKSDIYSFAVCMLELLSREQPWGNEQFLAKMMLNPRRPRGVTDDAWELLKKMSSPEPTKRLSIHQVLSRIQRLAEEEASLEEYYSVSSSEDPPTSDVDLKREAYELRSNGSLPPRSRSDAPRPHHQQQQQQHEHAQQLHAQQQQQQQLQRQLEDLRQKIRDEERQLERALERRHRVDLETHAQGTSEEQHHGASPATVALPPSATTKQLLRLLRWGTTEEQTQALAAIDANQVEHSALEIVRNTGLEIIVACIKHGHSPAFRQTAVDILQSITTAGTGLYLNAVLEHGVTQVLMGILHYRRIPTEQRRAGQFLVLLATKSARARSFFLQNAGVELLIKLLWQEQIPMFDKHFKARCDAVVVDDMRRFLATQAETRTREGDRAMEKRNCDLAMQKFTEAIVLDPRNGRLYAKRSEVYTAFRKFDHASKDAQQCIRLLPQYGEGYLRHAIALFGLNLPAQADRAVRQGRMYDTHFFAPARLDELKLHAPREESRNNDQAWQVEVNSVEF